MKHTEFRGVLESEQIASGQTWREEWGLSHTAEEVSLGGGRIHGLLWPGRYTIEMKCPAGSIKTEVTIVEGKRKRELAVLRESVATYSAGKGTHEQRLAALHAARRGLADIDPRSLILESFWPRVCMEEESVKIAECSGAFVAAFPMSRFRERLEYYEMKKHLEEDRRERNRRDGLATDEEHKLRSDIAWAQYSSAEKAIRLAYEFMALYPNSAHAPEVLQMAVFSAIGAGRRTEAELFAQDLVDRFPESREVKKFGGYGWLLPDPSNSERPQKRKLRRWGADGDR